MGDGGRNIGFAAGIGLPAEQFGDQVGTDQSGSAGNDDFFIAFWFSKRALRRRETLIRRQVPAAGDGPARDNRFQPLRSFVRPGLWKRAIIAKYVSGTVPAIREYRPSRRGHPAAARAGQSPLSG